MSKFSSFARAWLLSSYSLAGISLFSTAAQASIPLPVHVSEEMRQWNPHENWLKQDISSLSHELESSHHQVGPFSILWDASKGGSLKVTHQNEPTRVIWSSIPGKPFVMAGRGQGQISDYRGSFRVRDWSDGFSCTDQSILSVKSQKDSLKVSGKLTGNHCNLNYTLDFTIASNTRLGFNVNFSGQDHKEVNRTFLRYQGFHQEKIFGFGEQFTHQNVKGRKMPVMVREQGHLRGAWGPISDIVNIISPGAAGTWYTSYISVPQYISSERQGFFLTNNEYSLFDFTRNEEHFVRVWSSSMNGQIVYGRSLMDIIEAYTEYAGRPKKLPDWVHQGAIVGLESGQDKVYQIDDMLQEFETPIAGYWLQDWQGVRKTKLATRLWWNWILDSHQYPDWHRMVSSFNHRGIRIMGYINPFLSDISEKGTEERNLFLEAQDLSYLTLNEDGSPAEVDNGGFTGTLLDLTNPDAVRWYKEIIRENLIANGMSGWMADFGEALSFNAKLKNEDSSTYHNQYAEQWAKLNQEVIKEEGLEDEIFFFSRSGFTRSPRYTSVFWAGDQLTNWDGNDGLWSAVKGMVSGGFSGFAINHSDIGGLAGFKVLGHGAITRSQELFIRWAELSAFTGLYRTHEGNLPELFHQLEDSAYTREHFSYFAKIFKLLTEYRKDLFEEASKTGHPIMRHPILEYGYDQDTHSLDRQYFLGKDILVAPVMKPRSGSRELYLPKGVEWIHLWSEDHFEGGQTISVEAPWGQIPVFIRADSQIGQKFIDSVQQIASPHL